jgi:hypothetical protein
MGEHLVSAVADGFATQIHALGGTPRVKQRPGTIDYSWCPQVVSDKLRLGPTSVYWLSGLTQRGAGTPSTMSRVVADDGALPERPATEEVATSLEAPPDSPPMHVLTGSWSLGAAAHPARVLRLTLSNVKTLTVDAAAANLPRGTATVETDGPATLTLARLAPATTVTGAAGPVTAGPDGSATVALAHGVTRLAWRAPRAR